MGNVLDSVYQYFAWAVSKIVLGLVSNSEETSSVSALAIGVIERWPGRPVYEIKYLNHAYVGLIMTSASNVFLSHGIICFTIEDLVEEALETLEEEINVVSNYQPRCTVDAATTQMCAAMESHDETCCTHWKCG